MTEPAVIYIIIGLAFGACVWIPGRHVHRGNALFLAVTAGVCWPGALVVGLALFHPGLRALIKRFVEGS